MNRAMVQQLKRRFDQLTSTQQDGLFERFGGDCFEDIAEELTSLAIFQHWNLEKDA